MIREFWKHQSVGRPTLPFTTIEVCERGKPARFSAKLPSGGNAHRVKVVRFRFRERPETNRLMEAHVVIEHDVRVDCMDEFLYRLVPAAIEFFGLEVLGEGLVD